MSPKFARDGTPLGSVRGRWRSTQVRGLDEGGPRSYPAAVAALPTPGVGTPVIAPVQATSPAAPSAAIAR